MAGAGKRCSPEALSDLDLEKHVIRVLVPPPEVGSLLNHPGSPELTIIPVLFRQVHAVRAIFLAVPRMIVAALPIVIPYFTMIVGPHRHWGDQGSAGEKRA
jgi:hypothetical protein